MSFSLLLQLSGFASCIRWMLFSFVLSSCWLPAFGQSAANLLAFKSDPALQPAQIPESFKALGLSQWPFSLAQGLPESLPKTPYHPALLLSWTGKAGGPYTEPAVLRAGTQHYTISSDFPGTQKLALLFEPQGQGWHPLLADRIAPQLVASYDVGPRTLAQVSSSLKLDKTGLYTLLALTPQGWVMSMQRVQVLR